MIWFIILITVTIDGKVYSEIRPAASPEYNNEETCNKAGIALAEQEQMKIGTDVGSVYFICKSITKETFDKANAKAGQDI